ncbi:DNA polymerase III subunit alpha [Candidatus Bealeia paramacronuclearis]|uniref:DNA polymerase III subunit alpha n=1 Tax=Candidatus Bealeia paramacronuclearis TaxID=1921001 RepID=A0ABZ2C5T9_9PROT|nr:DNA polymerase III subunit alpha [Candidatus Bealeia paramacronuclearis]
MTDFVHLRCHTAYSLLEGAVTVKKLIGLAQKYNMPALAMTDTQNVFGALEFSMAAKDAGVQPIIGCQINITAPEVTLQQKGEVDQLILLVQSPEGYRNLMKLVSASYLKGLNNGVPQLKLSDLQEYSSGLIALTGGIQGGIGRRFQKPDEALFYFQNLKHMFEGRLYIELSRYGIPLEEDLKREEFLVNLALDHNVPLVGTNEVFFSDPDMYEAHDAMMCIREGTYVNVQDRKRLTIDHYFKSPQEMKELFSDIPEAIENTIQIARRCHHLLVPVDPILPRFDCGEHTEEAELRFQAEEGLKVRLEDHVYPLCKDEEARDQKYKEYWNRLEYELGVINQMGFPGYFLIVADFIKWSRSQNIPVGPGRGSGAGSIVAWALTITDVDPVRFALVFERFLNPERVSMPDFDIDFCQDRRDEVINYVQYKYGVDKVAQIITFGKLQARAVLRDVGRVLQMPYGQVDKICKLIPNNPANPVTIPEAIQSEQALHVMQKTEPEVAHLLKLAEALEGLYRHASTHAAGVVIGNRPLDEMVALYYDARSPLPATQFNMKYIEQAGLVKFDFLGLKTLTVIQKAIELIKKTHHEDVNISAIPLDDPNTFELLNRVETVGLFQVESAGMSDVMGKIRPDVFEDLIALVALYRPGPMDNIPKYLACKHGQEKVVYDYPCLEAILKESYGVILYQEQVLQIAQVLAGYTLGGADLLRRAMGKKIKSEMDEHRKIFVEGTIQHHGGKPKVASELFDQIAKFAGYAFNKAHSTTYALILYQTAYLKAHFPVEYMTALMTLDMQNTDKLIVFAREAKRMGIPLLAPDINRSYAEFTIETLEDGTSAIRYGLSAIKNVGEAAMCTLQEERARGGNFQDLFDFVERVDSKVLNKRQLENLIAAGVLDSLNPNRRYLFDNIETLVKYGASTKSSHQGLFSVKDTRPQLQNLEEWTPLERLRQEFQALGFYLSAHPLESYEAELVPMNLMKSNDIFELAKSGQIRSDGSYQLAGIIISKQERSSKIGQKFAFVQFSDPSGIYEVAIFSEVFSHFRDVLSPGRAFIVSVSLQVDGDNVRMTCQGLQDLEQKTLAQSSEVTLKITSKEQLEMVEKILRTQNQGRSWVYLEIKEAREKVRLSLSGRYSLSVDTKSLFKRSEIEVSERMV